MIGLFRRIRCSIFYLLLVINSFIGFSQQNDNSPQNLVDLEISINEFLIENNIPAIGLVLVEGDSILLSKAFGKKDIENNLSADEHTLFRVGSISKMFVSLAILKLQEEGRLSLKDKVRDIIPEIEFENPWEESYPILIEQLLEHTTGWDGWHLKEFALNNPKPLTLKEGLDYHPHSRTSRWVPGTRYAYSNSGPAVAAYIVEKVSGISFEDYVELNFFKPIGMDYATYHYSDGFKKNGGRQYVNGKPRHYWHIIQRPSGALNATINGMAQFVKFLINRGKIDSIQHISQKLIERMETPSSTIANSKGLTLGYGLSNESSVHGSYIFRQHGGAVDGAVAELSYLPEHNLGYVIMLNTENYSALLELSEIIRNYQIRDLPSKNIEVVPTKGKFSDKIESGYYGSISPFFQIAQFGEYIANVIYLESKNDTLIFGELKYIQVDDNKYASLETGEIEIVQTDDPLNGQVLYIGSGVINGSGVYKSRNTLEVLGLRFVLVIWGFTMIIMLISSVYWAIRLILKKVPKENNKWIRFWPLLSTILFLTNVIILVSLAYSINIGNILGTFNLISFILYMLLIAFLLSSVYSVNYIIRKNKDKVNKYTFIMSLALASLNSIVSLYLLLNGVIGLMFWNY